MIPLIEFLKAHKAQIEGLLKSADNLAATARKEKGEYYIGYNEAPKAFLETFEVRGMIGSLDAVIKTLEKNL